MVTEMTLQPKVRAEALPLVGVSDANSVRRGHLSSLFRTVRVTGVVVRSAVDGAVMADGDNDTMDGVAFTQYAIDRAAVFDATSNAVN